MSINVNNLSFNYGRKSKFKLDNLSFKIKNGSINVVLGLNGCGKTTLIKLLAGLLKPTEGSIKYDDSSLSKLSFLNRSKKFAYVAQKASSASDFVVRDYLAFGFVNSLTPLGSPKKEQLDKVEKISKELEINDLLDKTIGELSGGQYQLVSIVAAVLQNTPYIILDEPMSALDIKHQAVVLELIIKIAKEGKTIIFSSHNPNHALYLNSNVLLMKDGKIVMHDEAKKVVNIKNLRDIYGNKVELSKKLSYDEISIKR